MVDGLNPAKLSPIAVVRRVKSVASEHDREALLFDLKLDRKHATTVLAALARHDEPELRLFAPEAAADVLGRDAVPILRRLVSDKDSDVRVEALNALIAVDPHSAHDMKEPLRLRAQSLDLYEAQAALWALGAIRDNEGLDVIRAAKDRDNAIPRNTAIAVELLLTDPGELCRRIEDHDHELMPWLVKAAELLRTKEAQRALEKCAAEAPDQECRNWARAKLSSR